MSRILHIESATSVCSVALSEGGLRRSFQEAEQPNTHGERLTLLISHCLNEAGWRLEELDAVAISAGPGSYTALRVGAATAKGICYALGKPLVRVDTLQIIAAGMAIQVSNHEALYWPMIDARRMEVYTAAYTMDLELISPAQALIVEEDSFGTWEGRTLFFAGDGADKCKAVLNQPGMHFLDVPLSAGDMIPLAQKAFDSGKFEDVAYFSPVYLKPPNITPSKQILWGNITKINNL